MLTSAVLQTATPMTLNIETVSPDEILVLKSISGLTSTDVTLYVGDFASYGGYYQGRRPGKRNPVMTFKINPDYKNNVEASDIRETLYRMFHEPTLGSDGVQVLLKDDRKPDRYFIGYTEKIDADHFDKKQEAVVSMICTDPLLKSANTTTASDAVGWVSTNINYDGSADTGIELTLKVKTATTQIVVDINGVTMTLSKAAGFAVNDTIYINTNIGSRAIKQNGTDVMATLVSTSKWLQLTQPVNTFKTYGTAVGDGKVALMSYIFRSAWWGV